MAEQSASPKAPRTFKEKAKRAGLVLLVLLSAAGVYQVYEWALVAWSWYGENTQAVHIGLGLAAALLIVVAVLLLRRRGQKAQDAAGQQSGAGQGASHQQATGSGAQVSRSATSEQQRAPRPAQAGAGAQQQSAPRGARGAAAGPSSSSPAGGGSSADGVDDDDARMRELEALEKELNL